MDLYVVRHATAVPERPDLPDPARPLTAEGRKRFERAVKGMDWFGVRIDRLHHSPWLRAVETAELLTDLVADGGETVVDPGLARPPDGDFLAGLEGERVAVVGHQPWLTELVSILVCGSSRHGARIDLRKGGLVWLQGDPRPRRMTLRVALSPSVLRRV